MPLKFYLNNNNNNNRVERHGIEGADSQALKQGDLLWGTPAPENQ